MAITVSGTTITFNDGTTQSTAASSGAPTTAQVLNATAGASVGAVGTYGFFYTTAVSVVSPGGTIAGSNLSYSGGFSGGNTFSPGAGGGGAPAGTWRCMGRASFNDYSVGCSCYNNFFASVFLRIS
jgi:hypothetical protein